MEKLVSDVTQITPQWLTHRLRDNGHLTGDDQVTGVQVVSSSKDDTVTRAFLRAEYSSPSTGLPAEFFLKTGNWQDCTHREARFHGPMLAHMGGSAATVRCFDALHDTGKGLAQVLFEDVSQAHRHGSGALKPALRAESEAVVDAFAPIHAYWWDHPLLGTEFGEFPAEDDILFTHGVDSYQKGLGRFVDLVGDRLSRQRRRIYERALCAYPLRDLRGQSRLRPKGGLTLIHGDATYDNIFLPKDPRLHQVYLIDWAFWSIRVGTDDIANVGLYGFCEPRVQLLEDLVRRYYDGLVRHGVTGYGWEDCWHDYRLSTVRNLFIPLNAAIWGTPLEWCWKHMERAFRSFRQLGCAELLDD